MNSRSFWDICILCNEKRDNCRCSDKHKDKHKVQTTCFIETHVVTFENRQACNGSNQLVYEDVTNNHNIMQISVTDLSGPPCTVILVIETRNDCPPIERIIPPRIFQESSGSTFTIQVEDVKRVSIRCQGSAQGSCLYSMNIQKTFCICCPKDKDSHCC